MMPEGVRNKRGGVKRFSFMEGGVPLLSVLPPSQPGYEYHGRRKTRARICQTESLSLWWAAQWWMKAADDLLLTCDHADIHLIWCQKVTQMQVDSYVCIWSETCDTTKSFHPSLMVHKEFWSGVVNSQPVLHFHRQHLIAAIWMSDSKGSSNLKRKQRLACCIHKQRLLDVSHHPGQSLTPSSDKNLTMDCGNAANNSCN